MSNRLNTPHVVTIGAPLLRPGLTISATCSESYVPEVTRRLLAVVREINGPSISELKLALENRQPGEDKK